MYVFFFFLFSGGDESFLLANAPGNKTWTYRFIKLAVPYTLVQWRTKKQNG